MTRRLPKIQWAKPQAALRPIVSLIAWVYIYLVALLGVWIVIVMATAGWNPTVITSGSMSPSLRPGDVIMVEEHPDDLLGQRSVITFESERDDGGLDHPSGLRGAARTAHVHHQGRRQPEPRHGSGHA